MIEDYTQVIPAQHTIPAGMPIIEVVEDELSNKAFILHPEGLKAPYYVGKDDSVYCRAKDHYRIIVPTSSKEDDSEDNDLRLVALDFLVKLCNPSVELSRNTNTDSPYMELRWTAPGCIVDIRIDETGPRLMMVQHHRQMEYIHAPDLILSRARTLLDRMGIFK